MLLAFSPLGVILSGSHDFLGVFRRLSMVCQLHISFVACEAHLALKDLRLAGGLVVRRILGFGSH